MKSPKHIRDLYVCDNLPVLRSLGDNTVDLIYLDPPFNSKKQYAAAIATPAEGQKFDDTWKWDSLNTEWLGEIDRQNTALSAVIEAGRATQGNGTAAYLTMMGIRLIEIQRVLKPSGSIYLHCDDTANSYLRASMDAVFGHQNFINQITWRRFTAHSDAKRFGRIIDTILFYSNGSSYTWHPERIATPLSFKEIKEKYPLIDESGRRYRVGDLTGAQISGGESGKAWRGFDPTEKRRHWSVPLTGRYAQWIEENLIPEYRKIESVHDRLESLHANNMIILPNKRRKWPGLKRFADSDEGIMPQNLILSPIGFTNFNKKGRVKGDDYTGWRTQKPLELIRPLIKVSSNPGDLVLDPFCGCATACVAAEAEGRQWIGIDICEVAEDITKFRLTEAMMGDIEASWNGDQLRVIKEEPKPIRQEQDTSSQVSSSRSYRTTETINKLYGDQQGDCPGCGNHYRIKDMHVDHIKPKKLGGGDEIDNLQLLCAHCNATKGAGTMDTLWANLILKNVISREHANTLRKRWK